MNKIKGEYEEVMEFVSGLKEKASEDAKGMKFKQYLRYIKKDISGLEGRFEERRKKAA